MVVYTGSLVSNDIIANADKNSLVLDSASMDLDEIMDVFIKAKADNHDVARVHTGDPSIFGSTAEQMRRMREENIEYEIIPGVSSFVASTAALGKELTLPELSQTVIISRCEGRTPVPDKEKLSLLAEHQSTLVLFLSATLIHKVVDELSPHYGKDCPVAVVQRATWPSQLIVRGTLNDIVDKVKQAKIESTAIIIVGRVLTSTDFADSKLYSPDFSHGFRA